MFLHVQVRARVRTCVCVYYVCVCVCARVYLGARMYMCWCAFVFVCVSGYVTLCRIWSLPPCAAHFACHSLLPFRVPLLISLLVH